MSDYPKQVTIEPAFFERAFTSLSPEAVKIYLALLWLVKGQGQESFPNDDLIQLTGMDYSWLDLGLAELRTAYILKGQEGEYRLAF
jgi:hypothetical protein